MRYLPPILVVLTVVVLPVSLRAEAGEETNWKAGVATVVITPDRPMLMSGYASRDRPAEGTLSDLYAKVLVLEDAQGQQAVLITADLIGVSRDFSNIVCGELRGRYGLKRDQIAICTSHTHAGPVVGGTLKPMYAHYVEADDLKLIDDYTTAIQGKIVNAVHAAMTQLEPCRLSWGNGHTTFATNRRENPAENVRQWRTEGRLKGPFDHDVPVLVVHNQDDEIKTIVFGYACHATTLSFYQWTGDYPGFAQEELERLYPEAVAMFWAGCGADQNPLPRRSVALARHYGRRLATAVDAVIMTTQLNPLSAKLKTRFREIDLPFAELPSTEQLRNDAASDNRYVAARAKMLLERVENGTPLSETYPYPVAVWQLGDEITFVILGGEVVVDYALRLKSQLSGAKTWVAGYANDVMAYIPSVRVLNEGGYEGAGAMVYYGLPSPWGPEVEKLIVEEVQLQLD